MQEVREVYGLMHCEVFRDLHGKIYIQCGVSDDFQTVLDIENVKDVCTEVSEGVANALCKQGRYPKPISRFIS